MNSVGFERYPALAKRLPDPSRLQGSPQWHESSLAYLQQYALYLRLSSRIK